MSLVEEVNKAYGAADLLQSKFKIDPLQKQAVIDPKEFSKKDLDQLTSDLQEYVGSLKERDSDNYEFSFNDEWEWVARYGGMAMVMYHSYKTMVDHNHLELAIAGAVISAAGFARNLPHRLIAMSGILGGSALATTLAANDCVVYQRAPILLAATAALAVGMYVVEKKRNSTEGKLKLDLECDEHIEKLERLQELIAYVEQSTKSKGRKLLQLPLDELEKAYAPPKKKGPQPVKKKKKKTSRVYSRLKKKGQGISSPTPVEPMTHVVEEKLIQAESPTSIDYVVRPKTTKVKPKKKRKEKKQKYTRQQLQSQQLQQRYHIEAKLADDISERLKPKEIKHKISRLKTFLDEGLIGEIMQAYPGILDHDNEYYAQLSKVTRHILGQSQAGSISDFGVISSDGEDESFIAPYVSRMGSVEGLLLLEKELKSETPTPAQENFLNQETIVERQGYDPIILHAIFTGGLELLGSEKRIGGKQIRDVHFFRKTRNQLSGGQIKEAYQVIDKLVSKGFITTKHSGSTYCLDPRWSDNADKPLVNYLSALMDLGAELQAR